MATRSNSSLKLRNQLKKDYIVFPKVDQSVRFIKYLEYAKQVLVQAYKSYSSGDTSNAYISYMTFVEFVIEKLPQHQEYRTKTCEKELAIIKKATDTALLNLETIVAAMDNDADELLREQERNALSDLLEDEFDGPSESDGEALRPAYSCGEVTVSNGDLMKMFMQLKNPQLSDPSPATLQLSISAPTKGGPGGGDAGLGLLEFDKPPEKALISSPPHAFTLPSEAELPVAATGHGYGDEDIPNWARRPSTPIRSGGTSRMDPALAALVMPPAFGIVANPGTLGAESTAASSIEPPSAPPSAPSSAPPPPPTYASLTTAALASLRGPSSVQGSVQVNKQTTPVPPRPSAAYPEDRAVPTFMTNAVDKFTGISVVDLEILQRLLPSISSFPCPQASQSFISIPVGATTYKLLVYDYHISFTPFLSSIPPELQMSRSAIETNRCFFLHLGVAVSVHPFVLEVMFRHFAALRMQRATPDDFSQDILGTVMGYSTFVDANCLCFLWPIEFNNFRICLISGSVSPMFSCFSIKGVPSANLRDILVFCDGQHFTLMSSYIQTTSIVPRLLDDARAAGLVVQMNEVDCSQLEQRSIHATIRNLFA